jgi:hypothetical protein
MGLRRVDKHVVFWWLGGADRHWQLSSFVYRYRRINKHVGKLLSMFIVLVITGSGELFWVSNFWRLKTTKSRQSIEGVKAEIQC